MRAARVLQGPWLRRIALAGDDASLVLDCALGEVRIEAVTALPTYRVGDPDLFGLNLNQGGVLHRWGDQQAHGLTERSSHESLTVLA